MTLPWASVQVERVNRFLKNTLVKLVHNPNKWRSKLLKSQYILNNTVHRTTDTSLSKLLLGYEQRDHSNFGLQRLLKILQGIDDNLHE